MIYIVIISLLKIMIKLDGLRRVGFECSGSGAVVLCCFKCQANKPGGGVVWGQRKLGEAEGEGFEMGPLSQLTGTPGGGPSHGIPVLLLEPGKQGLEVVEQWFGIHLLGCCDLFQC